MDNILIYLNSCMFNMRLIYVRKLPKNDLGKIETCRSFKGLCMEHVYNFNVECICWYYLAIFFIYMHRHD
jgi:hypothetical protein